MPVACAPAAGGNAGPASAATSTATTRRIVVSFPRFGVSVRQGTQPNAHRSPPVKRRGPPTVWTGRERQLNQNRTPPVRTTWFAFPTTPRNSANGVRLPFTLNVVPPSRFRPASVLDPLTPPADADACAMFKPPPAYGRSALRAGT